MNNCKQHWVILVDDDEDDRFLIQQAFTRQETGYRLQTLSSGHELFQLLEKSNQLPSLLLLDLNMPLMTGFEVLERLRTHVAYRSIPIVILTTSNAEADRRQAGQLGANRFLTKPPTLEELTGIIAQLQQEWLVGE